MIKKTSTHDNKEQLKRTLNINVDSSATIVIVGLFRPILPIIIMEYIWPWRIRKGTFTYIQDMGIIIIKLRNSKCKFDIYLEMMRPSGKYHGLIQLSESYLRLEASRKKSHYIKIETTPGLK